jgi:single-strand DNA-binding protein
MARGLNKVMIIGHLGRAPEMRFTPNGVSVANFSVACDRSWKSADGVMRTETEWFNVVCWGNLAEIAKEKLTKGNLVYIEGRLQSRIWQDKEGKKHHAIEIVARELLMLSNQSKNNYDEVDDSEEVEEFNF